MIYRLWISISVARGLRYVEGSMHIKYGGEGQALELGYTHVYRAE